MKVILGIIVMWLLGTGYTDAQQTNLLLTADQGIKGVVILSEVVNGETQEIARAVLREGKSNGFILEPDCEGIYVLDINKTRHMIYMEKGKQYSVHVNTKERLYDWDKKSMVNVSLAEWNDLMDEIRQVTQVKYKLPEFFQTYQEFLPRIKEYRKSLKKLRPEQAKLLGEIVQYDTEYWMLDNLFSTGKVALAVNDYPAYVKEIKAKERLTDELLLMPLGLDAIRFYLQLSSKLDNTEGGVAFEQYIPMFTSQQLLGEFVYLRLRNMAASYGLFQDIMKKEGRYLVTESQKERARKLGIQLYSKAPVTGEAINFSGKDKNGKTVALSDFKGKVVLVDIWATWCGPCRAQIPFLKKLEKSYEGNNDIVFLSVSIDEAKDVDKWKDLIDKEALGGVQIRVDGGWRSDIVTAYQVKGVPRFIVFGKDGSVADADSPRPSDEGLKTLLDKELQK